MATAKTAPKGPALDNVAGFRPDQLIQGGLATDFDGTVTEARYCLWDYMGAIDEPVLGVRLTIKNDDPDEADVIQFYSAGDLDHFVPSMDGQAPSVEADSYKIDDPDNPGTVILNPDADGIFAFKVGSRAGLSNNSNWAQFIGALLEAKPEFLDSLTPDIRCVEDLHGHWDRVPQKQRKGLVQPGADPNKKKEILVLTAATPAPAATPAKAKAAPRPSTASPASPRPPASAAPPASPAGGDLDSKLADAVVAFGQANGGTVKKAALAGMVTKTFPQAEKQKAVKRVMDIAFLTDETLDGVRWSYDGDSGEVTVIE